MIQRSFPTGLALRADVTDPAVIAYLRGLGIVFGMLGADPPYGDILSEGWDSVIRILDAWEPGICWDCQDQETRENGFVDWMLSWTEAWSALLPDGGAFLIWGGVGTPGFRPFYGFLNRVERVTGLTLANHITWKKKRAYGVQHNYLFTREELAYFVKGDPKKPRAFNVPHLDIKRGYAGYDPKHPAKSEYLRRSNVWDGTREPELSDVWDETEILRGKRHPCQKPDRVCDIEVQTHSRPGDVVGDLFAGSGALSKAAQRAGRDWIAIEKGDQEYQDMVDWLSE